MALITIVPQFTALLSEVATVLGALTGAVVAFAAVLAAIDTAADRLSKLNRRIYNGVRAALRRWRNRRNSRG